MKNSIVRAKCVDMTVDGQGIAKSDSLVIFVKGMIKGEVADVKIIAEKKNYSYGIIDKLIEPSPHRIESDCPIAYKCGGCDFRHIDYSYQLELKKDILLNTFRGINTEVLDIIPSDNPLCYRNKVQVPVRDGKMGFYRKNSNDIVEFDDCRLESETANRIVLFLRPLLKKRGIDRFFRHILIKHANGSGEVMVGFIVNSFKIPGLSTLKDELVSEFPCITSLILNLNTRDDNVILGDEEKVIYGNSFISDVYDGIKIHLSLKSFYQVNYHQMLKLYDTVRKMAGVDKNSNVLDLYSGIGTISLYLARYAKSVVGVEIVEPAVLNAKENAELNQMNNVKFYLDDASKNMSKYLENIDTVVVDPPRKGLGKELIDSLISNRIGKIVYVSCNPATLARDLKEFEELYDLSPIQPVDMFPYTVHCENVVLLTRKCNQVS